VIGPTANARQNGGYSGAHGQEVTALAGLTKFLEGKVDILYVQGCDLVTDDKRGFNDALAAAKASDIVLYFAGQSSSIIGEGHDQTSLDFMGVQQELLEALYETNKPIVLIMIIGKPISCPWAKDHIPAIVAQWYGGEKAGDAIADMLFGNTVPCGKTPISWPQSVGHLPCYYNHLPADKGFYHKPGSPNHPGFDYTFSSPDPLWAFGHGLSYTTFEYESFTLSATELTSKDTLTVSTIVRNAGFYDGKEVVQLYFKDIYSSVATPVQQMKSFAKVNIPAGKTQKVTLRVPVSEFSLYNKDMKLVVEPGEYEIQVGSAADDIRQKQIIVVK
jgi:beta-glucosidase